MSKTNQTNNGTKGGLLKGNAHSEGGIKGIVKTDDVTTATQIEAEGNEPVLVKEIAQTTGKFTYDGKTFDNLKEVASEINQADGNGVKLAKGGTILSDDAGAVIFEPGQYVINKTSASDPTLHEFNGKKLTNIQILSEINQMSGGAKIPDVLQKGGKTSNNTKTLYHISKHKFNAFSPEEIKEIGFHFFTEKKDCFLKENRGYIYTCKVKLGNILEAPHDMNKWSKQSVEQSLNRKIDWNKINTIKYTNQKEIEKLPDGSYKKPTSYIILNPNDIEIQEVTYETAPGVYRNLSDTKFQEGGITQTENFKKWFANSKVVDENGEPLVVYHGTSINFNKFKISKEGVYGKGIYFTIEKDDAGGYADIDFEMNKKRNKKQRLIEAYLSLQNPLIVRNFEWKNTVFESFYDDNDNLINTTEELKKRGYDGIIITRSGVENNKTKDVLEIIAFSPTQIKSATDNNGEFNPNNPNILMEQGGKTSITKTENFKKWFGNSKVIDDKGNPLVVYHGTDKEFNTFDTTKSFDSGLWFTSNLQALKNGEVGAGGSGKIMSVYLKIENMAGWDEYEKYSIDEIIRDGFDGIKLDDDYIVFSPTQIKSATSNNGEFNPSNPNILMEQGGSTTNLPTENEKKQYLINTQNELSYLFDKPVTQWDEYDISNWQAKINKQEHPEQYNEGGDIRTHLADQSSIGQIKLFEAGGETKNTPKITIIDGNKVTEKGTVTYNWETIPEYSKVIDTIKQYPVNIDADDKGFNLLEKTFTANDELRPQMNGIYFDKKGLVASDAHRFIYFPYKTPKKLQGNIIGIDRKQKKLEKIDAKFPNYVQILPNNFSKEFNKGGVFKITVKKLLSFIHTTPYFVQSRYITNFMYKDASGEYNKISLKRDFIEEILEFALSQGHEKLNVLITLHNDAVIFTKENETFSSFNENQFLMLLMPMESGEYSEENVRQHDIDFERTLDATYDFTTDKVVSNNKPYEVKINQSTNINNYTQGGINQSIPYEIFKAFGSKLYDKTHPILGNFVVINGNMHYALGRTPQVIIKNTNFANGIYDYCKKTKVIYANVLDINGNEAKDDFVYYAYKKGEKIGTINTNDLFVSLKLATAERKGKADSYEFLNGITLFKNKGKTNAFLTSGTKDVYIQKLNANIDFSKLEKNYPYIGIPYKVIAGLNNIFSYTKPIEIYTYYEEGVRKQYDFKLKQENIEVYFEALPKSNMHAEFIEKSKLPKFEFPILPIPELAHNNGTKNFNYFAQKLISNMNDVKTSIPKVTEDVPNSITSKRLEILKNSLKKKEKLFTDKLQDHISTVKQANGQPLNDKCNGQATLNRWERQNDSLRNLDKSIEKTKNAIENEEWKIKNTKKAKSNLPQGILDMLEEGTLIQWRRHPNTFFVKGVDKARLGWNDKKKFIFHKYVSEIKDKDQYKIFAKVFNDLKKLVNKPQQEKKSK